MVQRIAEEVASNHIKLKPLEIETGTIEGIRDYFVKLDFVPVTSRWLTGTDMKLLGGRYCTIQGIDAAQLRVIAADGVLSTWYEATLPAEQLELVPEIGDRQRPAEFLVRGVDIRIWQEHGVVFAEAKEAAGR